MTAPGSSARVFLADLPEGRRDAWRADDLDGWLDTRVAEACAAWPTVTVERDDFVRYLARMTEKIDDPGSFRKLRTSDLYLAFACLSGDAAALAAFAEDATNKIERALARLHLAPATIEDLGATLQERLLFGREGVPPLLTDYSGRGDLGGWLRSIAVRAAFKVKKRDGRHVEADESNILGDETDENPEIAFLRRRHAALFEHALGRALARLETRERNLLRQHYLDGLNIDALGTLYGVHRATVARWIADARASVLDAIKNELADRMSPSEIESFIRQTRTDLGLSFSRILRATPRP